MSKEKTLQTASVLAFERKLDCSDGLFFAGFWDDRENGSTWPGIKLREKAVRGTISNRVSGKKADPAKLDAEIQKPNLQTVDVATLPAEADTLRLHFTLKVLPNVGYPSACNDFDYQGRLMEVVQEYRESFGFSTLAQRYAQNLANARFFWRNRMSAEDIEVHVTRLVDGKPHENQAWTFESLNYGLRSFEVDEKVIGLGKAIESGLSGKEFVLLEVVACARMGAAQEVFPSQELVMGDKSKKSKFLYSVENIAAMHSQKIGNALRTIDDWYPVHDGESVGPIAIEPYGSVTSLGRAFRQPKEKHDFYTLLDNWLLKNQVPTPEQQHYVMANFIRGGVFGKSEDK